mmetsp:Transcript_554/g.855  ORF Transcript_554/g.855 Transcript_554/m.855 type:complete len:424 (-) Transcript_554:172-1443(-)|eukprot:CAMPEP_0194213026 /NCGR_PEP_ID=MMETSP0156-20130528/13314_1 /TAXON_ID=33649 /ORGANISM="Thalassionema nitzschioides, Strain L26-B" /LENGTH=423 /DNA_ID=CAMNT_0038940969 /DNA_START=65 /DNA_END=1336 /DNA_ORIENTATION=-
MILSITVSFLLSFLNFYSEALAPTSWQKRLDTAFLDLDGPQSPQERLRLIQEAVQDPNLRKDVTAAIDAIRRDGFGKGHPAFIESLWPKGTIGRRDIEGIQTLVKTLPERFEELSDTQIADVVESTRNPTTQKIVTNVVNSAWEDRDRTVVVAKNVLRSDPKGVETLSSNQLEVFEASNNTTVEIRQFDDYKAVGVDLSSFEDFTMNTMGEGLAKLAGYVYGYNSEDQISEMTAPFIMQSFKMWIQQPSNMNDKNAEPSDSSMKIEERTGQTMALLEFPGICTNAEVKRRKELLQEALAEQTNWTIADPNVMVFQYNAPGTVPWRRKNQVGFVVDEVVSVETEEETSGDLEEVVSVETEEETSEDLVDDLEQSMTEEDKIISNEIEATEEVLEEEVTTEASDEEETENESIEDEATEEETESE